MSITTRDRILASLACSAAGDAMGAATENFTFDNIREKFDGVLREFRAPDETTFAFGSEAGQITDDFSQTYLLSQEIVKNDGVITAECAEKMLVTWSHIPKWFDHFAGPTTRAAIKRIQAKYEGVELPPSNEVIDYARQATNGAAMKISPAGLFNPGNVDKAIEDAITICMTTHDNQLSLAGACATAAAIAYCFQDGANLYGMIEAAYRGAAAGDAYGMEHAHVVGGPNIAPRLDLAVSIALGSGDLESKLRDIYNLVGTGLHVSEAVPAAFGIIVACGGDPVESVIQAVNIGYDTDTVACIAGSIVGALSGMNDTLAEWIDFIDKANEIDIEALADDIVACVERSH